MQQILKLNEPLIHGYQYFAFPLTVVPEYTTIMPWFLSNFIQIACQCNFDEQSFSAGRSELKVDFYGARPKYYPWLNIQTVDNDLFNKNHYNMLDFIMQNIDLGYYIVTHADEFFVPDKTNYKRNHFAHSLMVYGYDAEKKCLNTFGFNKEMKITTSIIPFETFLQAYYGIFEDFNKNKKLSGVGAYTNCYRMKQNWNSEFNIDLVKDMLKDYVNSTNTARRLMPNDEPPQDRAYGIEVYHYAILFIKLLSQYETDHANVRNNKLLTDFHIIWEHKKCMKLRVKFLEEHAMIPTGLLAGFERIENEARIVRNIYMKYTVMKDNRMLPGIMDKIKRLSELEYNLLSQLLHSIT